VHKRDASPSSNPHVRHSSNVSLLGVLPILAIDEEVGNDNGVGEERLKRFIGARKIPRAGGIVAEPFKTDVDGGCASGGAEGAMSRRNSA
jgi:hypothetical protein